MGVSFGFLKKAAQVAVVGAAVAVPVTIASQDDTVNKIKIYEGRSLVTYKDIKGVLTYCDGETLGAKLGKVFTNTECDSLTAKRSEYFQSKVCDAVTTSIGHNQLTAFTTFAYNIGVQGFATSTALKQFNKGEKKAACTAMVNWSCITVGNGKGEKKGVPYPRSLCVNKKESKRFVQGLMNRRVDEMEMCMKPDSKNILPNGAHCK